MPEENKWKKAQKKESESWLNTDMSSQSLLLNWKSRLDDFRIITEKINSDSSILDVGSGPISVLQVFPRCQRMVALDSLNDEFETKYDRLDYIEYISKKAEILDFPNNTFEFILCINALDHMDNHKEALKEMMRCLKPDGILFLEYENTSPLSIFLSHIGYKKPLNDFHPILVQNKAIAKILRSNDFKIIKATYSPQFNIEKIKAITNIIFSKRKMTGYEKNISALNYGFIRTVFHYIVISIERIFFSLFPAKYGYFTKVIALKDNQDNK